jgi:hypothetical protein
MVRIYPETIHKKDDEEYIIMKMVVYGLCFSVCTCVGLIVILSSMIERDIEDGSLN